MVSIARDGTKAPIRAAADVVSCNREYPDMTFDWTRERRKILVTLWNEGLPVADIRRALGGRIEPVSIRARIQIEQEKGEFDVARRTKGRRDYVWSEARIAKVLKLREKGLTNEEIGAQFIRNGKAVGKRAVDNLFTRLRKRGRVT